MRVEVCKEGESELIMWGDSIESVCYDKGYGN